MKDQLSEQQTTDVLKALEEAIEQGPWEESNFLRVIGKNLREIRDKFAEQVRLSTNNDSKSTAQSDASKAMRAGQQEIFIGLYSSDGSNLNSWERILANLPKHIISRPIYAKEEDIQEMIKTKEHKLNEAYVSIYIGLNDILELPENRMPIDKLGKHLLSLKNKSLNLENISHFVHQTGTYKLVNARLVKVQGSD